MEQRGVIVLTAPANTDWATVERASAVNSWGREQIRAVKESRYRVNFWVSFCECRGNVPEFTSFGERLAGQFDFTVGDRGIQNVLVYTKVPEFGYDQRAIGALSQSKGLGRRSWGYGYSTAVAMGQNERVNLAKDLCGRPVGFTNGYLTTLSLSCRGKAEDGRGQRSCNKRKLFHDKLSSQDIYRGHRWTEDTIQSFRTTTRFRKK